jgi:hypothetical protein
MFPLEHDTVALKVYDGNTTLSTEVRRLRLPRDRRPFSLLPHSKRIGIPVAEAEGRAAKTAENGACGNVVIRAPLPVEQS